MSKISFRFSNKNERGIVSFDAKYDEKYYNKYGMNWQDMTGCDVSVSIKNCRYINWSDKTGFILSRSHCINSLSRKKPRRIVHYPSFFDHTTFWKKPGDRWPSFCLTEPYSHDLQYLINAIDESGLNWKNKLVNKIFMPSEKSLWYPNSTAMIFIWNQDYFDFDAHEEILMSHEDANEFEKKLLVEKFERNHFG